MTLKYFQGFDIHRSTTNHLHELGWQSVKQDLHEEWQGPDSGYALHEFTTGFSSGQAVLVRQWMSGPLSNKMGLPLSDELRIGFYAKAATSLNPGGSPSNFIGLTDNSAPFNSGFFHYGVQVNDDGGLQMHHQGTTLTAFTANGTIDTTNYAYWEFYVNSSTGVFTLSKNGTQILTATHPTPPTLQEIYDGGTDCFFTIGQNENSDDRPFDWVIDHLYITDGDALEGEEVEGVAVVAAMDGYDVYPAGFRGALIVDGDLYNTDWKQSFFRSEVDGGDTGHNYCNVISLFFIENPATESKWTLGTYQEMIEAWGLCFGNDDTPAEDTSIAPSEIRVDAMLLAYLDASGTHPVVRYELPGREAYFSGPWRKGDTSLAYFAHVNDIPRQATELSVNSKSLYTTGPGCVLFGHTRYPDDPDEQPIQEVGVTFAEEFREDYHDFVRVDGWGANYESFAVSGYGVYGEGNRKIQGNYITVNYEAVTDGQAYVQGLWDYSIDPDTGRWSMRQLVYRNTPDGHLHFRSKFVIRGHGTALQIRFESQEGKPFTINGWSLMVTANGTV
jgi:hypothetical protein